MEIFFKYIIVFLALGFISNAKSDITVNWIPGEVVEGTPVDEWLLFCANASQNYDEQNPIIRPEVDRAHTFSVPDGATKCMMRARSNNNIWNITEFDSVDSVEVTFLVVGGVSVDPRPNAPSLVIN